MTIDKNEERVVKMVSIIKLQHNFLEHFYCPYILHLFFQCQWRFSRKDFKSALTDILFNDIDELQPKLAEDIKSKFENDHKLFDWTKDIFKKV